MGKWILGIVYALVMMRVVWIGRPDFYAIQKVGFYFMYLFSGAALVYFSWLYFELWRKVSSNGRRVHILGLIFIPLTPFGFLTSWGFCGGDPAVVMGVVAFCVFFMFGGKELSMALRRFFFSREGNEHFYNSFSERWQVLPFDAAYLIVNLASLYLLS